MTTNRCKILFRIFSFLTAPITLVICHRPGLGPCVEKLTETLEVPLLTTCSAPHVPITFFSKFLLRKYMEILPQNLLCWIFSNAHSLYISSHMEKLKRFCTSQSCKVFVTRKLVYCDDDGGKFFSHFNSIICGQEILRRGSICWLYLAVWIHLRAYLYRH